MPEEIAPFEVVHMPAEGGYPIPAVVRRPPGQELGPAVILIHGSWSIFPVERLKKIADLPLASLFLAGGYVTVVPTTRRDPQEPQSDLPLKDCLAIVGHVREMKGVDPASIVVYGESGGGSFVLELARKSDGIVAAAVHEPASVIFSGLYGKEIGKQSGQALAASLIAHPERYYSEETSRLTMQKLSEIRCPLYIQNGAHPIRKMNYRYFFPDLLSVVRQHVVMSDYPEMPHPLLERGGARWSLPTFEDLNDFFQRYLHIKPHPIEDRFKEWRPEIEDLATPMTLEQYLGRRNQ